MGKACDYCGQRSGLLGGRRFDEEHKACQAVWTEMIDRSIAAARQTKASSDLVEGLAEIARSRFFPELNVLKALVRGWERGVMESIVDGAIDADSHQRLRDFEEQAFGDFYAKWQVQGDEQVQALTASGVLESLAFNALRFANDVRCVREGLEPLGFQSELGIELGHPFNFQASEHLIYLFGGVTYVTLETRREFVGGSAGVSVPVGSGVRVRLGGFRGRPVEVKEEATDQGWMGITDKHVYFAGQRERFRVRLDKIIYSEPLGADGVAIERDRQKSAPEAFLLQCAGVLMHELIRGAPSLAPPPDLGSL